MIDRYKCDRISSIWTDKSKYKVWMAVSAKYLASLIKCDYRTLMVVVGDDDINEIAYIETVRKHDVAAFIEWYEIKLSKIIGKDSRFLHFGLTSSDVVDTAFSIMISQANFTINDMCNELMESLRAVSEDDTEITGRTHGKAAEVISLNGKFKSYASTLKRLCGQLTKGTPGKLSGPVGDKKHVTEFFPEFDEVSALVSIGCDSNTDYTNGQIISRAYHASVMAAWSILSSYLDKIATDMRILSMDGILEISEGFGNGQIGSSSMPHKKNPIGFENVSGLSRVVRSYSIAAMENIVLWNERDISHSSSERVIFPDASTLLGYQLDKLNVLIKSMSIHTENIKFNVDKSRKGLDSHKNLLNNIWSGNSRKLSHTEERISQNVQNNSN